MTETKRVIEVTDFEHRLMVNCMRTARNEYIDEGADGRRQPTDGKSHGSPNQEREEKGRP